MIERTMRHEQVMAARDVKILLLGAGESGKSTIVKQMKIIHEKGYSMDELKQYRSVVYSNTIQSLVAILRAMPLLRVHFASNERESDASFFLDFVSHMEAAHELPYNLLTSMIRLWSDPGLQQAFSRSNEYQLNDSAE